MKTRRLRNTALLVTAALLALATGCSSGGSRPAPGALEETNLNVAVVPVEESAGFFIALYQGLFKAQGLNVHFEPAISSDTVIDQQALSTPGTQNAVQITGGNYVSYIQAQQNWDAGQRPNANSSTVAANLDIFAEGSVIEADSVGIYAMPGSPIKSLAQLKGRTVAINAPGNVLYLMAASVLAEHGISPSDVHFVTKYSFPQMPAELASVGIDAAVLPEPFASEAQEGHGAVLLADLDQGATTSSPALGYAVTKQWAQQNPATLAAFYKALEQGQQIADTNRAAVEKAMEELPAPLGVAKEAAALMGLDQYPVSTGPVGSVDAVRLQEVVASCSSSSDSIRRSRSARC